MIHAYCLTCEESLSPAGTRKAAEDAREAHEQTQLKFEGIQHRIEIRGEDR